MHHELTHYEIFNCNCCVQGPSVPCCNICDHTFLDCTRPGIKKSTAGRRVAYEKEKCGVLEDTIDKWRDAVLERDVPEPYVTPSYILPNEAITKLSTLQLPVSRLNISNFLVPQWIWWSKYGEELMDIMLAVRIPDRTARLGVEVEVESEDEGIAENDDTSVNVVIDASIEAPVSPSSGQSTADQSHPQKRPAQVPRSEPSK